MDLLGAALRLTLIVAAIFLFLDAIIAVATASVVFGCQFVLLKKWASENVEFHCEPSKGDRDQIIRVIKKQAPNDLYYCIQGQITLFLVGVFGSSGNIANLGALTRFFIVFTILHTTFRNLYVPRFAKCQTRPALRRVYLKILASFTLFAFAPVGVLILFPKVFLYVLGPQYNNLEDVLPLVGLVAVLSAVSVLLVMLNQSRAWIVSSSIYISSSVILIALAAPIVNWKSIRSVLAFQLIITTLSICLHLHRTHQGFKRFESHNS